MEMVNITNCEELEHVIQEFTSTVENLWSKFFKLINITRRSKA